MDNNNYQQPNNQQPNYQYQQPYNPTPNETPMTVGDWIITLLITAIPCVGIIMIFVWAFGQSASTSKKNFCRATLIMWAIGAVLSLIFSSLLMASLRSILDNSMFN